MDGRKLNGLLELQAANASRGEASVRKISSAIGRSRKQSRPSKQEKDQAGRTELGGWMDGWMDGYMDTSIHSSLP